MSPQHSIGYCPICGGGLCGVRICGVDSDDAQTQVTHREDAAAPHGLIVCDECEAIWLEPDLSTVHQYPAAEDARCPVCSSALWGANGRWADSRDVESLGWQHAINATLDATRQQEG